MRRLLRFGVVALLGSMVILATPAQERILMKPGVKEADIRRTWKRYVTYCRTHPHPADYFFCQEWPQYRPVDKPEIRQALRTKCAEVLTEEGFGTREKDLTMILHYRGYYYVAVDWAFDDLAMETGVGTAIKSRICPSDPLHLYAFDRDLNHLASFHEGGFIVDRFTVQIAPIQFGEPACESGQDHMVPAPIGELRIEYPPAAKAMGLSGTVKVSGIVQPVGRVSELKVVESSNPLFIQSVLSEFSRAPFRPGRCGQPRRRSPFE